MPGSARSGSDNPFLLALRRWPIALLIAVGVTTGAYVAAQSPPSTYRAVSIVSFLPTQQYQADLVRLSLPRYQAFAASTDRVALVADELDLPRREVRDAVEVTVPAESPNIEIAVTTHSARQSATIANRLAELTVAFAENDGVVTAASLQKAEPPTSPSGPDRTLLVAAGLVAGIALGLAVAFLLEWRRPRIRTSRDLEAIADGRRVELVPRNPVVSTESPLQDPAVALAAIRLGHSMSELGVGDTEESAATVAVVASRSGAGTSVTVGLMAAAMQRDGRSVVVLDLSSRPRVSSVVPRPAASTDEDDHDDQDDEADAGEPTPSKDRRGPARAGDAPARTLRKVGAGDDPGDGGPAEERSAVGSVEVVRWRGIAKRTEVTTGALGEQLRRLGKRADVVIVDCPPVESGEMAVIVAGVVSMLAVVVPRRSSARRARRTLELAFHACRGPVLVIGNGFADDAPSERR